MYAADLEKNLLDQWIQDNFHFLRLLKRSCKPLQRKHNSLEASLLLALRPDKPSDSGHHACVKLEKAHESMNRPVARKDKQVNAHHSATTTSG
jgi:hypothetical protein